MYVLLLSWGGERAYQIDSALNIGLQVKQYQVELERLGVHHGDICPANFLWYSETRRLMLIDFERAMEMRDPKPLQDMLVNRKRKRSTIRKTIELAIHQS